LGSGRGLQLARMCCGDVAAERKRKFRFSTAKYHLCLWIRCCT
jgi:hypothetical protein